MKPSSLCFTGYTLSSSGAYFNSVLLISSLTPSSSHNELMGRLVQAQRPYIQRILAVDGLLSSEGIRTGEKPTVPEEFFAWEERLRQEMEGRLGEKGPHQSFFYSGWRIGDLQTNLELLSLSTELHLRLPRSPSKNDYAPQVHALVHAIGESEAHTKAVIDKATSVRGMSKAFSELREVEKIFPIVSRLAAPAFLSNDGMRMLHAAAKEMSRDCSRAIQKTLEKLETREAA